MSLSLQHVSYQLGHQRLLHDISLSLGPGCTAIIGPNGAGKSTLLRLLAGEGRRRGATTLQGILTLDTVPLAAIPLATLAQRRSFLLQQQSDSLNLSVTELLGLATYPHGGNNPHYLALYHAALHTWELTALAERSYNQLSGGERQRCQLARTWIQMHLHPKPSERIWLLDEPQTALDLPHQGLLQQQLQAESALTSQVVFSTHDINFALRSANRLIALCDGRIVADDSPHNIATSTRLQAIFGMPFSCLNDPAHDLPWVIPG